MQTISIDSSTEFWNIEPYSTRQATLEQTAIAPGKNTLQITLGGGRGNLIYLGRTIDNPGNSTNLSLRVQARIFDKAPVKMGLVFTSSTERPWLELKMEEIKPGQWQQLEFSLATLNRDKLTKTNRLNLSFQTDGDEGFVLIDRIKFSI